MKFLLSICIPTYNRKQRIVESVYKLMSAGIEELEICILDNASTDGTYEALCDIHDYHFKLIRNDTNIGPFYNHCKALFAGKGKYVVVVMDRDVIDICKLKILLKYLSTLKYDAILTNPYFIKDRMLLNKTNSCYPWAIGDHPSFIIFKRDILIKDWSSDKLYNLTIIDGEYVLSWTTLVLTKSYWDKRVITIPDLNWVKENTLGTVPSYAGRRNGHQLFYMPQSGVKRLNRLCNLLDNKVISKRDRYTRNMAVYAAELLRSTIMVYDITRPNSDMRIRYGFRHVKKFEYIKASNSMCIYMIKYGIKNKIILINYYYKVGMLWLLNRIRMKIIMENKLELLRGIVVKLWEKSYYEIYL